jgi:hypothetical protein
MAGYFAAHAARELSVTPVVPGRTDQPLRFVFDIAMAVRHGDDARLAAVNRAIAKRHLEIERVLRDFNVPLVSRRAQTASADGGL